jgi:hypothetical protein
MPQLLALSKLSLMELPAGFKLVVAPTKQQAPTKRKAKTAIAAPTIVAVQKYNAPIAVIVLPPKALPKKKKKKKCVMVYSTMANSSPRRKNALLPMDTQCEGTSFHSVLYNPFEKQHTSRPR